ncbi:MAG: phosphoglucomutase/phosphomannomutase family protein [Candidatus Koribacter versatilis]|uniref:Phosphoglucomutase/phosphomannomutase family protein n=1 Tax=Candidatus Korobacter versatilis TaxID=658062 RepID=A0A932EP49_9BACT|nr:phosphoglucomutase/phosphomannomutase family protein [Candidatus Koribacter versatilis]
MPVQIKFGTSGWRAVMAEDFTFANVRRAVEGVARYVASKKPQGARVIVGRDPRFLGETFVDMAANVLAAHGITPLVITEAAPTPAIAFEVRRAQADGAINFTASHNPAEYNGIKFSTPDGAPALPEVTRQIEAAVEAYDRDPSSGEQRSGIERQSIEVKSLYLSRIKEIIDLTVIKKAGLKVAYDPLWGAGRGYPDAVLRDAGVDCATVHDFRDVLFGGHAPEPDGDLLNDLRAAMKQSGAQLGISTDGDADRFGIVDRDGTFISPNYIIALLFDYLVETRGWKNGVAKSVVTTNMVNALAEKFGVPLYETPVGFKYIGELIQQDKIAIGGEESAGLSIRHHVPEKDGVLAGLLCCEMVARRGKSLREQLQRLFDQVGSFYPDRQNFRLTPEVKEKLTGKLKQEPREFAGRKVASIVRTDGLKLVLEDGAWVCYRLSGTEPVVRAYTEARAEADRSTLNAAAKEWVFS